MHMVKCCQGYQFMSRPCLLSTVHGRMHARPVSSGYYVLLPETPPDSADDNAILQYDHTPKFTSITPVGCITGCAKLAIQYETHLSHHIDTVRDSTKEVTFSQLFDPIEEISVPLNAAWRTSKNLNFVSGVDYTRAFIRIHPQVEKAKNERWNSDALYQACKVMKNKSSHLDEFQQRLVTYYLTKGRLNGIELQGGEKKRFVDTQKVLAQERANFRQKVMICQSMFSHRIDDFSVISTIPTKIRNDMVDSGASPSYGPWRVTLLPHIYTAFLEHCSDRMLRWNAWNAYNNRASVNFNDRNLGNHKLIEYLRQYRRDTAEMLGYDSFAEMSVENKMAGSVEKVLDMIDTLRRAFWFQAKEEIAELQKFAASEGFRDQLQMWDMAYWRRRHREHLYKVDHSLIAEYFPLETVLKGLFSLCTSLFKITITEHTGKVETWQEDVRYFEIFDENGRHMGSFFFDPFSRPGDKLRGAWMEMGGEHSVTMNTRPYSYLVMNLDKPASSSSAVLMQFDEVLTLFREFGHGLQQLLTRVPCSQLAGQNAVEWDARQVCASFLQRWPQEPSFLGSLTSHVRTGEGLPPDVLSLLLESHQHLSAFDMMRQLYLSAFDMEVHLSQTHWHDVMTHLWEEYMPLPLSRDDNHPCSFTHIFSDQYPAAYYSFKWADMIAADVFAAFREEGLDNAKRVQAIGGRFSDTFLSLGGGVAAGEVFRRFRGRDPSLDALLQELGASDRMLRMY
ncbi:uncharacterized protein LOC143289021 [Babylonia areolata]|uniref:uncharacterized protein LOC143289021 n=1 Tax=Babylonia areolata TaxID=304850 RepID=UPI003FD42805